MYVKTYSASLEGLEAIPIEVEVDISKGLPAFNIVGLADKSINEAKERVSVAMKACEYPIAPKRILVNLAPANIKKEGPQLDLSIAAALMKSFAYIECGDEFLERFCFLAELSLTGDLKAVNGMLSLALAAANKKNKNKYLIVSPENGKEANLVNLKDDIEIFAVKNLQELKELVELLWSLETLCKQELKKSDQGSLARLESLQKKIKNFKVPNFDLSVLKSQHKSKKEDFSEVIGQAQAKRGLEIAAAGNHHCLMIGPPGCGKSMLAKRFNNILPELSFDQAIETTKIYSVSGLLKETLITESPIRSPHHSSTPVSFVGGSVPPKPGEVTLAHNGVLFLDELTEFTRFVTEQLRQITDNKEITLNKGNRTFTYPADFILVAACNPCPCGYLGDRHKSCVCTPYQIQRYISKLSGPLLDRIDIHLQLNRLSKEELYELTNHEPKEKPQENTKPEEQKTSSHSMRDNVLKARRFKRHRLENCKKHHEHFLEKETRDFFHEAVSSLDLSARSHQKILKISRTIADMAESEVIKLEHLAEALQYRSIKWEEYYKTGGSAKGVFEYS